MWNSFFGVLYMWHSYRELQPAICVWNPSISNETLAIKMAHCSRFQKEELSFFLQKLNPLGIKLEANRIIHLVWSYYDPNFFTLQLLFSSRTSKAFGFVLHSERMWTHSSLQGKFDWQFWEFLSCKKFWKIFGYIWNTLHIYI